MDTRFGGHEKINPRKHLNCSGLHLNHLGTPILKRANSKIGTLILKYANSANISSLSSLTILLIKLM